MRLEIQGYTHHLITEDDVRATWRLTYLIVNREFRAKCDELHFSYFIKTFSDEEPPKGSLIDFVKERLISELHCHY